jgi:hypothetical protein
LGARRVCRSDSRLSPLFVRGWPELATAPVGAYAFRGAGTDSQELEKFFIATDELEKKKLEIIGWKGPKIAMKAIKVSAESLSKDGE